MADNVENTSLDDAKWYVVQTFSGHENKVQESLLKIVENRNLEDEILEVVVPMEEYVHEKDGKRTLRERKLYPGYILVRMLLNNTTWHLIKGIIGVSGFLGTANEPIPLRDEEVAEMGLGKKAVIESPFEEGEKVNIISGPLEGFVGDVLAVEEESGTVIVVVSVFGRDTSVEFGFDEVRKV